MSSSWLEVFGLYYGIGTLAIFWCKAVTSLFFRTRQQVAELEASTRYAQRRFWSLYDESSDDRPPLLPGLKHGFLTLSTGDQMHYMESLSSTATKTLIIMIHGFPDSWCIFQPLILENLEVDIVAIDLPGFGGSDDLQDYGPNAMLNAITETIHLLKKRYLTGEDTKCIVMGHDWGGVIAYRLAAETTRLFDRACLINTAYAPLMKANADAMLALTKPHLSAYVRAPWRTYYLLVAWAASEPLRSQLLKSCYIFMLNLPLWMLRSNDITIEYLLDFCHTRGDTSTGAIPPLLLDIGDPSPDPRRDALAQARAASFGPGSVECEPGGAGYGPSVKARCRKSDRLPGDWLQRIRLYREGLAAADWQLSPHLEQYALPASRERTSFKCPVTVMFGMRDLALDPRIVLDGIERYFQTTRLINGGGPGALSEADFSHIVELNDAGHWPMLDSEEGMDAMVRTMCWMVKPEGGLDSAFRSWFGTQKGARIKSYG